MNESSRPTLDQLAHREPVAELWTDKRTRRDGDGNYVLHGYLPIYEREWSKWRDEPIRIMEIGLNVGASVKLWMDYFTKARIIGVDIADFKPRVEFSDPARFKFVRGDAMDLGFWDKFRNEIEPERLDIIIDDGAHSSGTIVAAFTAMWKHVKPGGYYVVEDLTEFLNPASHTHGFPDQLMFSLSVLERTIMGHNDVDEAFVSKDLMMLRKKV